MQLFTSLLKSGTVVLFTSNKTPSELYKNGLNRQYFLPFVKLVQKQLALVEVTHHTCIIPSSHAKSARLTILLLDCYWQVLAT